MRTAQLLLHNMETYIENIQFQGSLMRSCHFLLQAHEVDTLTMTKEWNVTYFDAAICDISANMMKRVTKSPALIREFTNILMATEVAYNHGQNN